MRGAGTLLVILGLAACASTPGPAGPAANDLARLLAPPGGVPPRLRQVRCAFIAEEGSEWVCRYEERASGGAWVQLSAVVASDGDGWVLIDSVCTADQALADRGRCPR